MQLRKLLIIFLILFFVDEREKQLVLEDYLYTKKVLNFDTPKLLIRWEWINFDIFGWYEFEETRGNYYGKIDFSTSGIFHGEKKNWRSLKLFKRKFFFEDLSIFTTSEIFSWWKKIEGHRNPSSKNASPQINHRHVRNIFHVFMVETKRNQKYFYGRKNWRTSKVFNRKCISIFIASKIFIWRKKLKGI